MSGPNIKTYKPWLWTEEEFVKLKPIAEQYVANELTQTEAVYQGRVALRSNPRTPDAIKSKLAHFKQHGCFRLPDNTRWTDEEHDALLPVAQSYLRGEVAQVEAIHKARKIVALRQRTHDAIKSKLDIFKAKGAFV